MRPALLLAPALLIGGCDLSMKEQPRYDRMESPQLWRDGPVRQHPPEGTIAQGDLARAQALATPPPLTRALLDRGERDDVPVGDPMIYVTQQGAPRIVLFGEELSVETPSFASAWSDRLMVLAEPGDERPRVYYRAVPGKAVRIDAVTYRKAYQGEIEGSVTKLCRTGLAPSVSFSSARSVSTVSNSLFFQC